MSEKTISNCHECPFANDDNEFGKDSCNLGQFFADNDRLSSELPEHSVHGKCPLKEQSITIKLAKI